MDNRVILQVPLPKALKEQAEAVSADYGFSSLQEIIRVIITKLSRRELTVDVAPSEYIRLSPKAKKRYAKMTDDFRTGKNIKSFDNVKDLIKDLHA